jgi:molybdopterin-guanine dinucleotide biosynthesis protein A
MKTIVISGARSHVGKTTLVRHISGILKGTVCIKIGHHEPRPGKDDGFYYQKGILIDSILHNHKDARFLVIESNSILEQFDPDFCIFLDAKNPKPSAGMAIKKADIISGKRYDTAYAEKLALKTGIDNNIMRKIIWLSGARPEPVTGIVLAGGKSSRMGTDKAMLKIDGVPLAINSKDSITPFCDDVIISVNSSNAADFTGFHTVIDDVYGQGPIGGIARCLEASSSEVNLVFACDIPYIDPFTVLRMLSYIDDFDIIVPSFAPGKSEPLYGVYRKTVVPFAYNMLAKGQRRVSELFEKCRTKIIRMDDGGRYANLNTEDDVEKYKKNLIHCDDPL